MQLNRKINFLVKGANNHEYHTFFVADGMLMI